MKYDKKKAVLTANDEFLIFSELYHINRFVFLTLLSHCSGCLKYAQDKAAVWRGQGNQETLLIEPPFLNEFDAPNLIDDDVLVFFQNNHVLRPALSELFDIFQAAYPEKQPVRSLLMTAWAEMEKREKIIIDKNENLILTSIKRRVVRITPNEFEDLVAVGRMGLLRAVWKFNIFIINKNGAPNKFSTVAVPWIEQALIQYKNENMNGAGVALPDYLHTIWATLNQARVLLAAENQNDNTNEVKLLETTINLLKNEKPKIFNQYGYDSLVGHLKNLLRLSPHTHFSELVGNDDDNGSPLDFIEMDNEIAQNEHVKWLDDVVANLGETHITRIIKRREWEIVKMRLGIGMNGYALRNFEIAELMNVRPELVQTEFRNAINKIEKHLKNLEKGKK